MSKSSGDFLTVSLLESKGYNPLAYRLFCLQSHYRKPLTFSYESLDNAATAYSKLKSRVSALDSRLDIDDAKLKPYQNSFKSAMDNDLNTSLAVTCLYDVLKAQDLNDSEKLALVKEFDSVLSLDLEPSEKSEDSNEDLNEEITALIEKRNEARKNKDWTSADAIRDDLKARGIVLIDTPQGVTWKFEN